MKNKLLRSACLVVTVSLFSIEGSNPEVVYRSQTREEAFSFVMYLIKLLPWLNDNDYYISLPTHKDFEGIYQRPELLEEKDMSSLRKIFYEEVYEASKFDMSLEIIHPTEDVVKKALQKLAILGINWGFKIKQRYDIVLTLYGPGGDYRLTDKVGQVIIKMPEKTSLRSKEWYTQTIIHEIVHIGIEKDFVNKYNLSHWEKERLVDLICSLYLKDLLPWYKNQEITDKKIDSFIDKKVVIGNLPAAIESFIARHPRDSLVKLSPPPLALSES